MQKSPSGSYFPYYYKGGELFALLLGGYSSDEAGVIAMMKADEAFFAERNRRIGLWVDFYETKLTNRVMGEFVEMLKHLHGRVTKLGLVGCSLMDRWRIGKLIKKTQEFASLPVKYFDDSEEAKTWLVSERE